MKIAFICVNYNNFNYTRDYINSALKFINDCFLKIIIVDNASEKDDINQLDKISFQEVEILKSKKNVGYFKGLNIGIDSINVGEYDYIIIGNNDLTFNTDFINELSNEKFDPSIFVIAPNIIKPDGTHQNPHIKNKFNYIKILYRRIYFSNYYLSVIMQLFMNLKFRFTKSYDREGHNEEQIICMGYGACYVLTRNFFNFSNRLDAPNFLMGEEAVLANQILSQNGKIIYKPNIIVHHNDHTSIGKISNRKLYNFSKESYKYALQNHKFLSK